MRPGLAGRGGRHRAGRRDRGGERQARDGPEDLRTALARVDPGDQVELDGLAATAPRRSCRSGTRAAGGRSRSRGDRGRDRAGGDDRAAGRRITFDAKGIGGPSAGLAFALDIVDELGPDVDQGRKVVVTGELSLDGRVLPIGGIKQKTIAAREADADVFVVPRENADEAERYADGLEIVPVGSFDEALRELGVRAELAPRSLGTRASTARRGRPARHRYAATAAASRTSAPSRRMPSRISSTDGKLKASRIDSSPPPPAKKSVPLTN